MQSPAAMNDAEQDDVILLDRPVIVVDEVDFFDEEPAFELVDDDGYDSAPEDVILLDTIRIDDSDLEPA